MSNDDLLKQGIDHLKRFELKDAESCFTKVLDNDSENDTAKKGMMLKSLYTGFEQFEGPIAGLLRNPEQYDPDEYRERIIELSNKLVNATQIACSYYNDMVLLYDLITMRGAFYESRFKGSKNIDYCNLAGLYFSFACSWHTGAQIADEETLAELERAQNRAGYLLDFNERMKAGETNKTWDDILSDKNLYRLGLLRKNDDGSYSSFVHVSPGKNEPIMNEFGVLQSVGQAMVADI